jgi:hypothetical protein
LLWPKTQEREIAGELADGALGAVEEDGEVLLRELQDDPRQSNRDLATSARWG